MTNVSSRRPADAGIYHALMGSIWVILVTAVLAVPIGVAAAIYLEEYGTRSRLARLVEINITNLAAVPSIITACRLWFIRAQLGWAAASSTSVDAGAARAAGGDSVDP